MIIWLTGQPGSGKTTIALELKKYYPEMVILDGDVLRKKFDNKEYSRNGRIKNIKYAQSVARSSVEFGFDVCVALVAPYREVREAFKKECDVIEVYLTSNRELRKEYHVPDYEEPLENFIQIDTDQPLDKCIKKIVECLEK